MLFSRGMKKLCFLLLFLFCSTSFAIDPTNPALLLEEKVTKLPNPYNLQSNWWEYYVASSSDLQDRIEETKAQFSAISNQLDESQRAQFDALSGKFLEAINRLRQLKIEPAIPPTYAPIFPKEYSYSQWLRLRDQKLELERLLAKNSPQEKLLALSIKSRTRFLDSSFSSYLTTKHKDSFERLIKGLEIMTMQANVEVEELNLKELKSATQAIQESLEKLSKEIAYSHTRLNYASAPLESLQKELVEAKEHLDQVQREVGTVYENRTYSNEGERVGHFLSLNLRRIEACLEVINLESQVEIIKLGLNKEKSDPQSVREQIQKKQELVHKYAAQLKEWKEKRQIFLEETLVERQTLANTTEHQEILDEIGTIEVQLLFAEFYLKQLNAMKKQLPLTVSTFFLAGWEWIRDLISAHGDWYNQSLFKIRSVPVTPLGLFKFILIIVIAYLIGKLLRRSIHKLGKKTQFIKSSSVYIISRIVYYVVLLIGIMIAGASIGFDLTAFAVIAGVVAVWVGLSLQGIFHNFVCGIIVLLSRTVKMKDILELPSGDVGKVTDVNLRTTILTTSDGTELVVPNAELVGNRFVNRTLTKYSRRITVPFQLPYDVDKQFVKEKILEGIREIPITLATPEADVWFNGYSISAERIVLECTLAVWVNEHLQTRPNITCHALFFDKIDDVLRAHDIRFTN